MLAGPRTGESLKVNVCVKYKKIFCFPFLITDLWAEGQNMGRFRNSTMSQYVALKCCNRMAGVCQVDNQYIYLEVFSLCSSAYAYLLVKTRLAQWYILLLIHNMNNNVTISENNCIVFYAITVMHQL